MAATYPPQQQQQQGVTLTQKVIDALGCAGTALERLEESWRVKQAQAEKLASLAPRVAQTLISTGLIERHETNELNRALADPETTLALLEKVAQHHAQTVSELVSPADADGGDGGRGTIGTPTDVNGGGQHHKRGSAAYGSHHNGRALAPGDVNHPYAGARTSELKESDRIWFRHVLGYVPDEGGSEEAAGDGNNNNR